MSDKDLRWGNVVALGALVLPAVAGCDGTGGLQWPTQFCGRSPRSRPFSRAAFSTILRFVSL